MHVDMLDRLIATRPRLRRGIRMAPMSRAEIRKCELAASSDIAKHRDDVLAIVNTSPGLSTREVCGIVGLSTVRGSQVLSDLQRESRIVFAYRKYSRISGWFSATLLAASLDPFDHAIAMAKQLKLSDEDRATISTIIERAMGIDTEPRNHT